MMNDVQVLDRPDTNGHGTIAENLLNSGRAMQQVRSSYATAVAVQKPRQLQIVERRLLDEARLGGEDMYYGWQAGKDRIEGPSVDLALSAARCWGNCAVEPQPVQDAGESWIFTAAFVDLETGFTLSRQFRQSKQSVVHGKLDEERKADIRFQIGQSKAIRNVVLNALPPSLIKRAMNEAKAGVREKIEEFVKNKGLPAAVDLVVKALAKCGVTEAAILAKVGVAERKAIDIDHLVTLRGDLVAIENGRERAGELFPVPAAAAAATATEKLKEKLGAGEQQKPESPKAAEAPPAQEGAGQATQGTEAAQAGEIVTVDGEVISGQDMSPEAIDARNQAAMAALDAFDALKERIGQADTTQALAEVSADMAKQKDVIGPHFEDLTKVYNERHAAIRAKGSPAPGKKK